MNDNFGGWQRPVPLAFNNVSNTRSYWPLLCLAPISPTGIVPV